MTGAVGVARRRWRALVIAVAAVLLAFLGTYLAMNLTGDGTGAETAGGQQGGDDEGSEDDVGTAGTDGGGTNGETTAGGSDDIEDPPDETTDPTDGSGEHPGTEPAQDPKEPVAPELPQGFVEVVDTDFHFRIALPEGWERLRIAGENSGGVYGDPAGDFPTVQVDFTSSPGNDAAAAWRVLEPATREASDNYRRISIKEVEWRGYPTVADWRFTRTVRGQRVRVLDRGFKVDENRGYAIMITCVAEEWDGKECRTLRDTAFGTFQPLE